MKSIFALTMLAALTASCSKSQAAVATGEQACTRDLKRFVTFNDPDSARVNSIVPNDRAGNYDMSVSVKNAMGGYGAPVFCTWATERAELVRITCNLPT